MGGRERRAAANALWLQSSFSAVYGLLIPAVVLSFSALTAAAQAQTQTSLRAHLIAAQLLNVWSANTLCSMCVCVGGGLRSRCDSAWWCVLPRLTVSHALFFFFPIISVHFSPPLCLSDARRVCTCVMVCACPRASWAASLACTEAFFSVDIYSWICVYVPFRAFAGGGGGGAA